MVKRITPDLERLYLKCRAVKDMTETTGWHMYQDRLNERIVELQKELETCDIQDVYNKRGFITGLRYALEAVNSFIARCEEMESVMQEDGDE